MQRWQKALLAGVLGGAVGYSGDLLITGGFRRRLVKDYALAAMPAALLSASAAMLTYLLSRPAPGEGFPEKV